MGFGDCIMPVLACLFRGVVFHPHPSPLPEGEGVCWLGVGEIVVGAGCSVWIPAFAGMTGGVGGITEFAGMIVGIG